MPFWRDDFPALLLDFGVVVEDGRGTKVRGILGEQDEVRNDGSGDVLVRVTTLTLANGALDRLARGDTLRTWLPDAPATVSTWRVRDVLVRQDGSPLRCVLALT